MKKYLIAVLASVLFLAFPSFADVINGGTSVNVDGTLYQDYFPFSTPLSAIPGMNTSDWNPSTGLGTFTYTDTTAGDGFIDVFINLLDTGNVYWNDYATFSGALAAGESAQADVPDYDCDANECGNVVANTNANTLNDENNVPGQLDNYDFDCGADGGGAPNSACNNDVGMAIGFNYDVPTGDEAVVTFTISDTAPTSGFYIAQTKPADADDDPGTVYFSGDLTMEPVPVQSVPEPPAIMLFAAGLCALPLLYSKRCAKAIKIIS